MESKTAKKAASSNKSEIKDPETLRQLLLQKIKNYTNRKNLSFVVTADKLTKFSSIGNSAKCLVQCVYCETKVPCTFEHGWRISNLTKHILRHNEIGLKTSENPIPLAIPPENQTPAVEIERARCSVLNDIQNILQKVYEF